MRYALAACILAALAPAQTIVRPGENLQAAIDATPSGGWVWIQGGWYSHVQIVDKSLMLFASPPASIEAGDECTATSIFDPGGHYYRAAPIEARGTGAELLGLWGIVTYGTFTGNCANVAAPGVRVDQLAALYVFYCGIRADEMSVSAFVSRAVPGLWAERTPTVHVEASHLLGGNAVNAQQVWPPLHDGGAAVFAPGLTVTAIASVFFGGDAEQFAWFFSPSPPTPLYVSARDGGFGGHGVVAADVRHYGSLFTGGQGARVYWYDGARYTFLAQQPSGSGIVIQ